MTKQTEALKMAIEAMDTLMMEKGSIYQQALQACKEALEQPTLTYEDGFAHGYEAHRAEQALEQPAQEPVMYQLTSQEQSIMRQAMIRSSKVVHKAHPAPSWQGLSDDEILIICAKMAAKLPNKKIDLIFARAIEAKLKEKNNG